MKEVEKFLTDNPVLYVATAGLDGKPKVRPFLFMFFDGGKLYLGTSNKKPVFAELQKQPYIEISSTSPKYEWIRISGKAVFTSDLAIKEKILERSPLVKQIYQTASNPDFEAFYIAEGKAVIADFSGNPPNEYSF